MLSVKFNLKFELKYKFEEDEAMIEYLDFHNQFKSHIWLSKNAADDKMITLFRLVSGIFNNMGFAKVLVCFLLVLELQFG